MISARTDLRAISGSPDYHGLDVLPSNLAYRKFDLLLDRMKKRSQSASTAAEPLEEDYDRIIFIVRPISPCSPRMSFMLPTGSWCR